MPNNEKMRLNWLRWVGLLLGRIDTFLKEENEETGRSHHEKMQVETGLMQQKPRSTNTVTDSRSEDEGELVFTALTRSHTIQASISEMFTSRTVGTYICSQLADPLSKLSFQFFFLIMLPVAMRRASIASVRIDLPLSSPVLPECGWTI